VIKLALPAGDLRAPVAELLSQAGLRIEGYGEGSRSYRLTVPGQDGVSARVFREKDIPIQVALGNYDLGIAGLDWLMEMQTRFPQEPLAPLADMGIGGRRIVAAGAATSLRRLEDIGSFPRVRIASEYPNIAEAFARAARLRAYRVQAVWGAAEAYPPEDADLVVVAAPAGQAAPDNALQPLFTLLDSSAWLIGNAASLAGKDLSPVLRRLIGGVKGNARDASLRMPPPILSVRSTGPRAPKSDALRMAVPDGHQQRHAAEALAAAGLRFDGYDASSFTRRPVSQIGGLEVKVIRPHDMPQLVATGEMDIAITGRDCLNEHLYSFPSSPACELLDLRRGQYNLSAVVSEELPASTMSEALEVWRSQGRTSLRLAAEFPATADHYARSRHFWRYQVIPISGASEGFVPEDADMLIEGTETGRTIAENKLKVIDLLYRSTTCLIGRKGADLRGRRQRTFDEVVAALRRSADAASD